MALSLRPSDFAGRGLGRPGGMVPLTRSVTVRGAAPGSCGGGETPAAGSAGSAAGGGGGQPGGGGCGDVPLLDWNLMDSVLLLRAGRTLAFDGVAVANVR